MYVSRTTVTIRDDLHDILRKGRKALPDHAVTAGEVREEVDGSVIEIRF